MLFKDKGQIISPLSKFDLIGHDEVALAKIFAYILGKDKDIFSDFMKICDIHTVITEKVYQNSTIVSEVKYKEEGRTDIEIDLGKEHIIIEIKVKDNKVKESQLNRYQSINKDFHIILISSKKEYSHYKNITWDELILELGKRHEKKTLFKDFCDFYRYRYHRRNEDMQEILIQDLAKKNEIERYCNGCIYKGHAASAYPLYFAPYFTKRTHQEGLISLAKILFIMKTTQFSLIQKMEEKTFREELKKYAKDTLNTKSVNELVDAWLNGIKIPSDSPKEICTFYFLDFPQKLPFPLLKGKGGAKGWISLMIPKNRMLSFDQIFYQIQQQKNN